MPFGIGWLAGRSGLGSVIDPATLPAAERAFADRMRNVTLVGTFTTEGRSGEAPSADRYEIASVDKVGESRWRFNAKIDCCGPAGQSGVPIVVPMHFVGDTPVIMMTDTELPGIGTFTVRLFFYGNRYVGTWQHGASGGQMSGRIEKMPPRPDRCAGEPAAAWGLQTRHHAYVRRRPDCDSHQPTAMRPAPPTARNAQS